MNSLADSLSSYLTRREAEEGLRETHAQLQALSRQLMHLQEQERQQLAHDLHDEVGQALTALKMNLQTMQRIANMSPVQNSLTDSVSILDTLLARVRDLSLDLRPSLLDHLGLVPATAGILSGAPAGLRHVDVATLPQDLPADMAVVCFRIVQEAVTNVLRNKATSRCRVANQRFGIDLIVAIMASDWSRVHDRRRPVGDWACGHAGRSSLKRTDAIHSRSRNGHRVALSWAILG
jgi:signal transduction histidine kinase